MKKYSSLAALLVLLLNGRPSHAQDSLTAFIDALMAKELKPGQPGGVVMVARKGTIVYSRAFGLASVELGVPVKDDMIFPIASNTKQFTAVCILQLVEQGKLRLQDTIGRFMACGPPAGAITIRQLLSQTSGLGNDQDSDVRKMMAGRSDLSHMEKEAYIILHTPLAFAPGSKWEYNNNNYQVLGLVLEKISGMPYAEYVDKNIFRPAGMMHACIGKDSVVLKNRVDLYANYKQGLRNIGISNLGLHYASGGIEATAEDLFKWNQALKSGKLVGLQLLKLAFARQPLSNGDSADYGFGWRIGELHGSPMIWHGGLVPGCTSETIYLPREDVYIVIIHNAENDDFPIYPLGRIISGMAIHKPYRFTEVAIDSNALRSYVGRYESDHAEPLNITAQDGKLWFQRPGGRRYQIRYAGGHDFFFDQGYLTVQFRQDGTGKTTGLVLSRVDMMPSKWTKTAK